LTREQLDFQIQIAGERRYFSEASMLELAVMVMIQNS